MKERGIVYTTTVVHSAPGQFVAEAPYQIVIVTLEGGRRVTGRVAGAAVAIDEAVILTEERDGVPFFQKHP